jgi:hypothetical protein
VTSAGEVLRQNRADFIEMLLDEIPCLRYLLRFEAEVRAQLDQSKLRLAVSVLNVDLGASVA